jgi:hypothetical protein
LIKTTLTTPVPHFWKQIVEPDDEGGGGGVGFPFLLLLKAAED